MKRCTPTTAPWAVAAGLCLAIYNPTPAWSAPHGARADRPASASAPAALTGGWVREAPPGATVMAAYLTISNPSKAPLVLATVKSPFFQEVQMHTTVREGTMERMKRVLTCSIPPGGQVVFKPGGNHFMLMHPARHLAAGDRVPFTLSFGAAGSREVVLEVQSTHEEKQQ